MRSCATKLLRLAVINYWVHDILLCPVFKDSYFISRALARGKRKDSNQTRVFNKTIDEDNTIVNPR